MRYISSDLKIRSRGLAPISKNLDHIHKRQVQSRWDSIDNNNSCVINMPDSFIAGKTE
jgi:hypothetical protein